MTNVLVNGMPEPYIDTADRGFNFGDGLFTTILIRDGRPCLWPRHWQRLQAGCAKLAIAAPTEAELLNDLSQLTSRGRSEVAKIIVTRGSGGRGYQPLASAVPNRAVVMRPLPEDVVTLRRNGIVLARCTTPLARNPVLAGLKHLNRLEQVLASIELAEIAAHEGLMSDTAGNLVECTRSNLFMVRDGRLVTPPLHECGVAGVMRAQVIESAADLGLTCDQSVLTDDMLATADEIFVTNAIIGIWPVIRLLQSKSRSLQVGPVTAALIGRLEQDGVVL